MPMWSRALCFSPTRQAAATRGRPFRDGRRPFLRGGSARLAGRMMAEKGRDALSHSLILLSSAPVGASSPQKGGRPSFPILLASLGRREKGCDESMRQRPAFPACKTSRQAWRGWQGKSPRTVQPPGAFLIRKRSESQRLLDAGLHYALAGLPHATCFSGD